MKSPMTLSHHRPQSRFPRMAILALAAFAVTLALFASGPAPANAQSLPEVPGVTWTQLSSTSVRVEWPNVAGATTQTAHLKAYGAADSEYSRTNVTYTAPSGGNPARADITGMTANTVYTFRARAISPQGNLFATSHRSVFPVIAVSGNQTAVPGLTATTPTATSIKVDWNAVNNANGYFVSWTSSGEGIRSVDLASTARTHTIDGLTTGTEYTVRVAAIPSSGAVLALSETKATPAAQTQTSDDDSIWSATLTVANIPTVGNPVVGYGDGAGSLTPNTFSHGGASFTVSYLGLRPINNRLFSKFAWTGTPTYASAYALCFDGDLAFTGSASETFNANDVFKSRTIPNPSWSVGDEVDVKLYEGSTCPTPPAPPPPPRRSGGGSGAYQFLADDCEATFLAADGTFNGRWSDDPDCEAAYSSRNVSRFYWFTLPEGQSEVTFTLQGGGADARMWLWPEWTNGHVATGDAGDPMRARFLTPGVHFLEVDSGESDGRGAFKITMEGIGAGASGLSCSETSWTFTGSGSVQGRWDAGCTSGSGYYRYYNLTLTQPEIVTFDVTSPDADPNLVLSTGDANDDYNGSNRHSRISRVMPAGTHLISVYSKGIRQEGTFTLGVTIEPSVSCAETYRTIGGDATIAGEWKPICEYRGSYARYYDLVVGQRRTVTLTLDSTEADPLLQLSQIAYTSGAASLTLLEADERSTTRSEAQITRALDPGRYRIYARALQVGAMGGFTLKVSGLGAAASPSCADTFLSFSADHTVTDEWGPGCDRDRTPDEQPYYQRSYDLVVKQRETLTLVLTSTDADPLLRLYDAERVLLASNDDHNGSTSRSRIVHNFERGTYRIEASTKNPQATGAFKLEVTGGVRSFTDNVACGTIPPHRIVDGETATGQWTADCRSTYFTFDTNLATASYHITLSAVDATSKEVAVDIFLVEGSSPIAYSRLDIALATANNGVVGLWSDGETMWVSDPTVNKIFAYRMDTGQRAPGKEFSLASGNEDARGIWSDGTTMWVANAGSTLFAYNMATKARDQSKDFTLATENANTEGIWSDGETMWVADYAESKLYAYNMATKAQDSAKDIDALSGAGNTGPGGIWSDGTTMWVADSTDNKLYAYNLSDDTRDSAKDIENATLTAAGITATSWGIWSDGRTMWAAGFAAIEVYAFRLSDGSRGGTQLHSSERLSSSGLRSDLDAWIKGVLTTDEDAERGYNATYSYEARLSPDQARRESSVTFPVTFTLTHKSTPLGEVKNTGVGGDSGPEGPDTAPTVTDTSQFKTHYFLVGQSVSLTLPAADEGSGNGGPYDYNLWHRGAGKSFTDQAINGLSFDPLTRTLTGTPEAEGEWELSYVVHDGDGNRNATDAFREKTDLEIVVEPDNGAVGGSPPQQSQPEPENQAPNFDANIDTTLEVPENSPAGTNVGSPITATDPNEGDTLTYVLSGADAASFAIDNAGQITTITGVTYDYEVRSYLVEPSYSLTVTADDGRGMSVSTPVTVTLTDVDDAPAENLPPEFHEGASTTREVAENSPAGTKVGKPVTAYDLNGDALSYIALDGDDGAAFAIDDDGQLTTVSGVTYDYETKSSYQFMLIVMETETDEGYLSGISVTVSLTDVDEGPQAPDTAPTVTDTTKFKTHYATVGKSFSLALPAADANSGNGGSYTYQLLKRADGSAFSANGLSFDAATRTLSGTPTAEDSHELTYRIHDADDNRADSDAFVENTKLKIVVVPDGNAEGGDDPEQSKTEPENQAPSFDANIDTTLEVPENSAAGTNVGAPITATDPDEGDTLTYSLSGTDATSFSIGASTGQITTKSGVTYDYETKKSYSLAVDVSDGNGGEIGTPVTVSLTDVNEAPVFSEGTTGTREVAENSAAGTSVGAAVTATDPDSGNTLAYTLSGTDAASFEIGSSTGQITIKSGVTYDYETKKSYSVAVGVSDGNGGTDSIAVTVNLTDVNETPPEPDNQAPTFSEGASATRSVAENSAAGTSVGAAVTATDPDTGDTLTYSLSGTDAASFEIGGSTGQITTKTGVTYDYETKKSYSVTVGVSDGNGGTDSIAVTVNLTDVNETPPVVEKPDPPAPTPPTASAGADFNGKRGEAVTLSGSGTANADGSQALTYGWRISGASHTELASASAFLSSADSAEATFTMPRRKNMTDRSALDDGNWIDFELTVTDGDGESSSDTVRVTISGTTWTAN